MRGPRPFQTFHRHRGLWSMIVLGMVLSWGVTLAEEPQATPYRPTVSNPAQLPVPGYLELEMGWQTLRPKDREAHTHNVPYLFKFAFNDRIGVLVGGDAIVVNDPQDASSTAGFGDLTPVLKLHFPVGPESSSAFGLETGVKIPTASSTIGNQQTDYMITGIYSVGLAPVGLNIVSVDLNLGYTRLGGTPGGAGKDLVSAQASVNISLTDRLSVAGELAGSTRRSIKPFSQLLTSASYFLKPGIVADAGMAFGLNGASQEWTAFTGVTVIVGNFR